MLSVFSRGLTRPRPAGRDARGTTTLEFTLITTMMLGIVLGGIEASIQYSARAATTAAAQAACERARAIYPINPTQAAQTVADQTGLTLLAVTITPGAATVQCTVTAASSSVLAAQFTATATMPKEGSR